VDSTRDTSERRYDDEHGSDHGMKVYVLSSGKWDDRAVDGVFSTPELAMAAHHPEKPTPTDGYSYTWGHEAVPSEWVFDADWQDYADVVAFELDEVPQYDDDDDEAGGD
jgi:hypothetical protein